MARILIAGCGYVGQATADLFHEAGWTVEGWTRSRESAGRLAGKPYPVYALDITNRVEVCTRIATFDAVIHCASSGGGDADTYHQIYLNGARNLLDRFNGSIVVFTSSSSVYARNGPNTSRNRKPGPRPRRHCRPARRNLRTRPVGVAKQVPIWRSDCRSGI